MFCQKRNQVFGCGNRMTCLEDMGKTQNRSPFQGENRLEPPEFMWHLKSSLGWMNQYPICECWSPKTTKMDENSTSQTSSEPKRTPFFCAPSFSIEPRNLRHFSPQPWKWPPSHPTLGPNIFYHRKPGTLLFAASKQVSPARPLLRNKGSCQGVDGAEGRWLFPWCRSNPPKV